MSKKEIQEPSESEKRRFIRVLKYMQTFEGVKNIDLLVLKTHVLIDHELKRYLAFRLLLTDDDYERFEKCIKHISFYQLANIALSGTNHRELLSLVLKLNEVRNQIAHKMDLSGYEDKLSELNRAVWKTTPPEDQYVATLASLPNLWAQVVQSHLDTKYGEGTFESVMS